MRRIIFCVAISLGLFACDTGDSNKTKKGSVNAACEGGTVDLSKFEGVWAKQVLHNDGRKEWNTEFRLRIDGMEDGKLKGSYVAGINTFEMEGSVAGETLLLSQIVSEKDEAVFRENNSDPNLGLRRLLTIRPKARGCKVEVIERYETYVDGQRQEQRTGTAQYTLVPYDKPEALSFEECTDVKGVTIAKGGTDGSAPAGTAVTLRAESDKLAEGCTPVTDFFVMGERVAAGVAGRVEGGKAYWELEHTFAPPKAGQNATFVEIYRYAQCPDSKKLSGVACNVVPLL